MSPPDPSALRAAIGLKVDLIGRLQTSQPSQWPELVTQFVAALERLDLRQVPIAGETKRIIDQRYAEPLTLDMLAGVVGRSKRHLGTVFQQEFGLSVHDYLTRVRLNRAMALIQAGEKIEAVSLLVGYRSKKNFYRNFRAYFGVTPIACRTSFLGTCSRPKSGPAAV
jgi:AraC-like DNA-binding protein